MSEISPVTEVFWGYGSENPDTSDPAVVAWNAISSRVPELGRYVRVIEPKRLTDSALTVSVPDERTYIALTNGLNSFIDRAICIVLGRGARLQVEIAEQDLGVEVPTPAPS